MLALGGKREGSGSGEGRVRKGCAEGAGKGGIRIVGQEAEEDAVVGALEGVGLRDEGGG